MPCNVLQHSLGTFYLNALRRETTGVAQFREASDRLAEILAIESTRTLPMRAVRVETPLESLASAEPDRPLAVVAILRAGLGMVDAFRRLLPEAPVGMVGLERDEQTARARHYYTHMPPLRDRVVFVVDPMLATGGSAEAALEAVCREHPAEVRLVSVVAAPEGVARVERRFPEVEIFTAALDRELNANKYILPGLGDYGDRLYGTR